MQTANTRLLPHATCHLPPIVARTEHFTPARRYDRKYCMPSYRFIQVDVFTDQPFGGNPLAVFPDAQASHPTDAAAGNRLNLSETTFVLPPRTGVDFKVRIFMPVTEILFAGHRWWERIGCLPIWAG